MSSLRLFKVAMCGLDITKNFSVMHKLQRLVRLVYAVAFARIFHVTAKTSFNFHQFGEVFTELGVLFPSLMFK